MNENKNNVETVNPSTPGQEETNMKKRNSFVGHLITGVASVAVSAMLCFFGVCCGGHDHLFAQDRADMLVAVENDSDKDVLDDVRDLRTSAYAVDVIETVEPQLEVVEKIVEVDHVYTMTSQTALGNGQWECRFDCGACDDWYTIIVGEATEAHAHSYAVVDRKDATCTSDGYVKEACECGAERSNVLPATGHNYVEDPSTAVAPKVGVPGKTADKVCKRCGDIIPGSMIPALEAPAEHQHSFVVVEDRKATCCEQGYWKEACECGEFHERTTDALGHDYVVDEESRVEPKVGVPGKEADKVCDRCGDRIEGNTIPALEAPAEEHTSHKDETICGFNEWGWGFYTNLDGEDICTTKGAYRQYLTDNYPDCTIVEDGDYIWAE